MLIGCKFSFDICYNDACWYLTNIILRVLSASDILGRADSIASVLVDSMLGIQSSRTHNP